MKLSQQRNEVSGVLSYLPNLVWYKPKSIEHASRNELTALSNWPTRHTCHCQPLSDGNVRPSWSEAINLHAY